MIKKTNTITLYGISGCEEVIYKVINELYLKKMEFDIKLILTEAISNAYYHGNNEDDSKPIFLSYELTGKVLNLKIKDVGSNNIELYIPDEIQIEDILSDGGRGLFLIKCLADNVIYKDNTLIIDKYIYET
jgi:serine/threonine-protein kinase RsbW